MDSISLSAMEMRQIDRYFRASMLKILLQQYLPGADIRYKPFTMRSTTWPLITRKSRRTVIPRRLRESVERDLQITATIRF